MTQHVQDSGPTLTYATPAPAAGSGLAAGVWITLAGLALIFLGGCFCVGIMLSLNAGNLANPSPFAPVSSGIGPAITAFVVMLYVLAAACFISAVAVMTLGIRKLLAVGRA